MIAKTINFTDYNGVSRSEKYYFNMSKAEILRLEMSLKGGIEKTVKKALAEEDNATLFNLFEQLILKSYGKKTADGGFAKSEADMIEFSQTEAYSEFLMELFTDPTGKKFSEFFKGILPKDYSSEIPDDFSSVIESSN